MTPTLQGRWQTRLFLTLSVGLPCGYLYSLFSYGDELIFIALLFFVLYGFAWDSVYDSLQRKRWEGDWPVLLAPVTATLEGISLWLVLFVLWQMAFSAFLLMYVFIWLAMALVQFFVLPVLFPKRRFRGGRLF